ncbi:hypothetical protein [Streptomyces sp. NPDC059278]|uniref:hypothetical protein n=1 Tax=Streptomyces sp. NPDC059278 TaxID=3346801 RepID=UPI0036CCA013
MTDATTAQDRDHRMAVDALYGELSDEANARKFQVAMNGVAASVAVAYDLMLPLALGAAGPEAASREQAREALASILTAKAAEEIQGAAAAAALNEG